MAKKKAKKRVRPTMPPLPPRIDASPEELARAMFNSPPSKESNAKSYHCERCGRQVIFPEVLNEDGVCLACNSETSLD